MTKKSHSFTIGAMILVVLEKCRETELSLEVVCAELEARIGAAREIMVKAFMDGRTTRRGAVVDL
jgi:predicted choloylglycine hydrolase